MSRPLDFIALGRSSVDIYGEQIGGRLEDMASFAKYIGGSPTNTAVGGARLGLKTALITRVGDEHMGRFIRETLQAEGVDTRCVKTDPARMTALVILGIRDRETFPLIFYRENCADMAIDENDFDEAFIASAQALVISGTHLSTPSTRKATLKAVSYARKNGVKVVLDIDYRPVLWGLTGKGAGENRFVENEKVSAILQEVLPLCDLIVGTEEEFHIAGASTDTLAALKNVRKASAAALVCKRGPMGCAVFTGDIPASLDAGISGRGFPINVYNVLGAGDGFMAGFLRGWLRGEKLEECCRFANAVGAIVVSRHGCAPAVPSWEELSAFLKNGSPHKDLRFDPALNQLHWSTTRTKEWPEVLTFAFDHRSQLEDIAKKHGADVTRISTFKQLAQQAAQKTLKVEEGLGVIIDGRYGLEALFAAEGAGGWIARPIEVPGQTPLQFEGGNNITATLREWPLSHTVKCLVFYHPEDDAALRKAQIEKVALLQEACRATRHELLLEVISSKSRLCDAHTVATAIGQFYAAGIYPDWWKLQSPADAETWRNISAAIEKHDPHCRGVLLLGLDAPEAEMKASFLLAADQAICKGFAVGRTIFGAPAEEWFAGKINDEEAVKRMSENYARLVSFWRDARKGKEVSCRKTA
jgi:5-dehydro-2-deoxygluconokinase